jgi:hypothetical protein
MSDNTVQLFGNTERVFIYEDETGEFYVRPAVVVVDGNHIRFRNFTGYTVELNNPDLFGVAPIALASVGSAGDRKTVPLVNAQPGFHPYQVTVLTQGAERRREGKLAQGNSRPGAIIDR